MDLWKRDALVSLEHDLKLHLSLTDLMSRLERPAGGFMTETDRVSVEVQEGRLKRVGRIIEILRKRGNEDYDLFLKILRETGNEVWATAIEETAEHFKQEYANQGVCQLQRKRNHGEPSSPLTPLAKKERVLQSIAAPATTGSTVFKQPPMPTELQVVSSVFLRDKVYITGITSDSDEKMATRRQVQVYSLEEKTWSTVPEAPRLKPAPNYNAPMAVIDNRITLIGGRDAKTGNITDVLSTWFEDEHRWKQVLPPLPTRRLASGICYHDNLLLVTGGVVDSSSTKKPDPIVVNTVHVYNFSTRDWSSPKALELPVALRSHHLVVLKGNVYLLAGATAYPATHDQEHVFNSEAWRAQWSDVTKAATMRPIAMGNVWKPIANPPVLRSTVISCKNSLLSVGGMKKGPDCILCHQNAIYEYVEGKNGNQWIEVGNMSTGRYRHAVVPVGDRGAALFIAGGFVWSTKEGDEGNVKSSSVELVLL